MLMETIVTEHFVFIDVFAAFSTLFVATAGHFGSIDTISMYNFFLFGCHNIRVHWHYLSEYGSLCGDNGGNSVMSEIPHCCMTWVSVKLILFPVLDQKFQYIQF